MKQINKVIAIFILIVFGTTFVVLESHGSSLCSASEMFHQWHSEDANSSSTNINLKTDVTKQSPTQKSERNSNQACHCTHSSNCAVNLLVISAENAFFAFSLNHIVVQDEAQSVFFGELIKPPRA